MSISLKIVLVVITFIYLVVIVSAVKRKKLQTSFSVFWIITCLLLIIALCIPNLVENISNLLGFEKTSNMIFCLAIFVLFYLVFNLTTLLSKEFDRNVKLIQEISILKRRIDKLEEEVKYVKKDQKF